MKYARFLSISSPLDFTLSNLPQVQYKPTGPTYKMLFLNHNRQESSCLNKEIQKEIPQTEITDGKEENKTKRPEKLC